MARSLLSLPRSPSGDNERCTEPWCDTSDPDGSGSPPGALHLKTNDDPAWDAIVAIMQDVVPDVGVLITPVGGDRVRVAFIDPHLGAQHNIKDLGTGVEQLLMTTYVGVRQPERSVIIVEEPETNLHSGAQRALLRYIREWSRERLFILATHSPIFLDESLGQSRVYLVERASGVATVRNVGSALADVLLALEVRLSDVLSAEHIVLVEGESDAEVIRAWFPDLTIARGVAIASMGGGDRVWASDTLTRVLARVDELDRTILVLRDRDELPENAIDALAARGNVHVLARRELENYLLDVPAIRT